MSANADERRTELDEAKDEIRRLQEENAKLREKNALLRSGVMMALSSSEERSAELKAFLAKLGYLTSDDPIERSDEPSAQQPASRWSSRSPTRDAAAAALATTDTTSFKHEGQHVGVAPPKLSQTETVPKEEKLAKLCEGLEVRDEQV